RRFSNTHLALQAWFQTTKLSSLSRKKRLVKRWR
ncbi:PTS system sugar-specific permease component family protein, partial [Vibrio parahaemolyticus V-223/04]